MTTLTWDTATEWDNAVSEDGVVHESTTNTDHNDATIVKQGYSASSPYEPVSLAGYWPFHEDSGSTAYDFSGNNNDGTIVGATMGASAPLGTTGYDLDGVDDGIDVGNPTIYDQTTSLAITAWVYLHDATSRNYLHERRADSGGATEQYRFEVDSNGYLNLNYNGTGGWVSHSTSNTSLSANIWYFVGVTISESGGTTYVDYYLNGSADGSSSSSNNLESKSASNHIGYSPSQGRYFDGIMWDHRLHAGALSADGHQTLYDVVNRSGSLMTASKVS